MNRIPKGWTEQKVSDFVTEVKEKVDPAVINPTTYIGLEHIKSHGGLISVGSSKDVKSTKTAFNRNDVLYGKLRPYLNKHIVANTNGVCSTDILVYRSKSLDHSKYFNYWLNLKSVISSINTEAKGINLPRVAASTINSLSIPVPPEEQIPTIVTKLDALFGHLDRLKVRMDKIPKLLKQFRQAVLTMAVTGKLTEEWRKTNQNQIPAYIDQIVSERKTLMAKSRKPNRNPSITLKEAKGTIPTPNEWVWTNLNSICDPTRSLTYGVIKLGAEIEGGVPCLRTSDVRPLRIYSENVKKISKAIADQYPRTYLHGGEILINVRGTLGGIAVVEESLIGFNVSREIAVVPILSVLNPNFLAYVVASPATQRWLTTACKGIAYTGINIEDLVNLPTPVTTIEEQNEIVRSVKSLFALADQIETSYNMLVEKIDQLPQAILTHAFRGDLAEVNKVK